MHTGHKTVDAGATQRGGADCIHRSSASTQGGLVSLPTGGVEIAVDGSQRGRAECTYRGCGFYTTGIGVSIHRGGGMKPMWEL
jgi:hypothetical protein